MGFRCVEVGGQPGGKGAHLLLQDVGDLLVALGLRQQHAEQLAVIEEQAPPKAREGVQHVGSSGGHFELQLFKPIREHARLPCQCDEQVGLARKVVLGYAGEPFLDFFAQAENYSRHCRIDVCGVLSSLEKFRDQSCAPGRKRDGHSAGTAMTAHAGSSSCKKNWTCQGVKPRRR